MFTGIVEELGRVVAVPAGDSAQLRISASGVLRDLPPGGSLAVNGVCLTAVPDDSASSDGGDCSVGAMTFTADVMGETLERTSLGQLQPGDSVNLERCMPAGGRFDGHIVQGHVDCTGTISVLDDHGGWTRVRIDVPKALAPYLAEKGSVSVDGTSLTITAVSPADEDTAWFEVGLIPATLANTIFGRARMGQIVNIEVDVIAKYAARLADFAQPRPSQQSPVQPLQTGAQS